MVCFVAIALTLPTETILLRALSTSDKQAAKDWADSLSDDALNAVADHIQAVPFEYRKAALKRLGPGKAAKVWRENIQSYIDQHPNLSESAKGVLYNAIAISSPNNFANPTDEFRAQIGV